MPKPDLYGIGVVVTRPAHQAEPLCRLIEQAGGQPFRFPLLEILPPADPQSVHQIIERLAEFDLAIFVSPNAVERAFTLINAHGGLPPRLRLAAVGKATAQLLERFAGRAPEVRPTQRFDSEGLLAEPALQQVAGTRIIIFRGDGGRELLAGTLRERGARVEYAEVYRRGRPRGDLLGLLAAVEQGRVAILVITSVDALRNLLDMAGSQTERLKKMPLVVVSERLAESARALGFVARVIVARAATDEALVEAVTDWAASRIDGEV